MATSSPSWDAAATGRTAPSDMAQVIRFCRGRDGTRLAYAVHGSGPPLIIVSCWLSHLQHDWRSPVWRHFLESLGGVSTIVRYDERGFGMSDWDVEDVSLQARIADLEAIVEALGSDRFALLGMSGGSPVAMAYAARNPARVTRLILYGAAPSRPRASNPERDEQEMVYREMIRVGWAKPEADLRRVFTRVFIPDATEGQLAWFDDLQRMSTSPANAVRTRIARQEVDIDDLVEDISVPTLILQATGDRATGFAPGPEFAARIRGARLVALDSKNHILLEDEPAWSTFMAEVGAFLAEDRGPHAHTAPQEVLSPRERDVLALAADGLPNVLIAERLGLSIRTVERHLSNVYGKLGLEGSAARVAAVSRYLRHRGS